MFRGCVERTGHNKVHHVRSDERGSVEARFERRGVPYCDRCFRRGLNKRPGCFEGASKEPVTIRYTTSDLTSAAPSRHASSDVVYLIVTGSFDAASINDRDVSRVRRKNRSQ